MTICFIFGLAAGPATRNISHWSPILILRAISTARARMESGMPFRAEDFDAVTMHRISRPCWRLSPFLCLYLHDADGDAVAKQHFFERILEVPAIVGGMHFEPGGWQVSRGAINDLASAYDKRHGRNDNWLGLLAEAHRAGRLYVHEFKMNAFAFQPLSPFSIASWARGRVRPICRLGSAISLAVSGDSASICRYGWSHPEDWGCWMEGSEAGTVYCARCRTVARSLAQRRSSRIR